MANALAQYNDNLSWEGDSTKASAFLEAIRWLLVNRPQSSSIQGRSVNYTVLEAQQVRVQAYVDKFSGSVSRASFVRGRAIT